MSILIYCQHLSGAGHFVRSYEIARAFASAGDNVLLTDGGRVVPRRKCGAAPRLLALPRIYRLDGTIAALEEGVAVPEVMAARLRLLLEAIDTMRPDVLIIEHFPFSKWCLAPEILPIIERARAAPINARVFCSVRDLVPPSPLDNAESESSNAPHRARALDALHTLVDGVLVHGDARLARLEEYVPWASHIETPVHYTGYVSEKAFDDSGEQTQAQSPRADVGDRPRVILSTGGAGDGSLALAAIEAWRMQVESGESGDRDLIVFVPPFSSGSFVDTCLRAARGTSVYCKPFGADFIDYLSGADLSISHAGYNTCANILETRTRAIVVPVPHMPDQIARAALLARQELVHQLKPGESRPEIVADAIRTALNGPRPPRASVDLDGARRTVEVVRSLASVTC